MPDLSVNELIRKYKTTYGIANRICKSLTQQGKDKCSNGMAIFRYDQDEFEKVFNAKKVEKDWLSIRAIAVEMDCTWQRAKNICSKLKKRTMIINGREIGQYCMDDVRTGFAQQDALPRHVPAGMIKIKDLTDLYGYHQTVVGIIRKDDKLPKQAGIMLVPSNYIEVPFYKKDELLDFVNQYYLRKTPTLEQKKLHMKFIRKNKPSRLASG